MGIVQQHSPLDANRWNAYVLHHPEATSYHLWGWSRVLGTQLNHIPYYLSVQDGDQIRGILPLILMLRPVLGRTLVSLPFVNYGGILASGEPYKQALLEHALALTGRLGARSLELRHIGDPELPLPARTHRVAMILDLPKTKEQLWKMIGSKLRNQVRKAEKSNLQVYRGGLELLDSFYEVFVENMRDLGSPVWCRSFFADLLSVFSSQVYLYRVDLDGRAIAAGFTFRFRKSIDIPWASSLRSFNHLCANVLLYYQIMADAVQDGFTSFDFGRCAKDGGTFKFKQQWGAREVPLYWSYWPSGSDESSEKMPPREFIEQTWRRLPLWSTRLIGPPIRRYIPQ